MKKRVQNLGPEAGRTGESRSSKPLNQPPMKKIFTMLCVLVSMICTAVAQPAMISKGNVDGLTYVNDDLTCQEQGTRDVLDVQIIFQSGDPIDHPVHTTCPVSGDLQTNQVFSWYLWETDLSNWGWYDRQEFICGFDQDGYVKVTVGDDLGNTGTDSVWFHVTYTYPMENFIMEIGDDLTPTFSGIATEDHYTLQISRCLGQGQGTGSDSTFFLSPGEWTYNDQNTVYQEDSLWVYICWLRNTCGHEIYSAVPGLLLNTKEEGDSWYLDMRTLLQSTTYYHDTWDLEECVYFVYTVDSNGQRHHFTDGDGNLVILPEDATTWQIPGKHVDPHYQCGVAKVLEDGTYELVSLSNKVENPLLDTDGVEEQQAMFSLYPNPAQGHFTVEGTGTMTITNVLGQTVLTRQIEGTETIELPRGLYFVKLNGQTRKIVVE